MVAADLLRGHPGVDMLYGGTGRDVLDGGDGHDVQVDPEGRNHHHLEGSGTLEGCAGADVLISSHGGEDLLVGGDKSDRFLLDTAGQVTSRDFTRGEDKLDLSLISGGRTCKGTIRFAASGAGTEISWPDAKIQLLESGQLTQDDVIRTGPCRVVFPD